jgi:hypothetical protein
MPGAGCLVKEKTQISDPVAIIRVLNLVGSPLPVSENKERGSMLNASIVDRDGFNLTERNL